MMQRRGLILAALAAPFIARTPGLLMPVKPAAASRSAFASFFPRLPPCPPPGTMYFDIERREVRVWNGRRWDLSDSLPMFLAVGRPA